MKTVGFVCGEGTQGGTLSRPPQTCCSASSEASFYIFSRGATVAQNTMSTRSGPRLDPNAGCGVPLSPSSLVPQTPMSPSYLVPRPSSYNLDETMFVASVRKGYHEEFQQAIAEATRVYAGQISRLDAAWPPSSTVVPGSSDATPLVVGEDLLD